MKPVVDRLQQEYAGKVEFKRYDVDNSPEGSNLMLQFNSQYVPTFVFVNRDGSVSLQKVGGISETQIRQAIAALH